MSAGQIFCGLGPMLKIRKNKFQTEIQCYNDVNNNNGSSLGMRTCDYLVMCV